MVYRTRIDFYLSKDYDQFSLKELIYVNHYYSMI